MITPGDWRQRDVAVLVTLALILVALAWAAGFASAVMVAPGGPAVPEGVAAPENFGLFGEAWGYVDREFNGTRPDGDSIARGAVTGLVEALDDPRAAFLPAGEPAASLHARFAPTLGAWVGPVAGGVEVLSLVPAGPAAEAGLVPGDVVLAVDQEGLAGLTYPEALDRLAGVPPADATPPPAGSAPTAAAGRTLIVRGRDDRARAATVRRASVDAPVSSARTEDGVPVVVLAHLGRGAADELDAQLERAGAARDGGALVLDLRDNPGGNLEEAALAAGRFMDGPAWTEERPDGSRTVHEARGRDLVRPDRLVVLANGGTVGAAEALAAALRDGAGARIVGEPTFGRQEVERVFDLSDGSLIRLTVARWLTPSGESVADGGLEPSVAVAGHAAQSEAALRAARGADAVGRAGGDGG